MKIFNSLKPRNEFRERARVIYLASFRENFPTQTKHAPRTRYFFAGLASGIGIMVLITGSAVYADQKNVSADNRLYPLKRIQENINLSLANQEEKPNIELKLAERRANELKELKQRNPSHVIIQALVKDLKESVSSSLIVLNDNNFQVTVQTNQPIMMQVEMTANQNDIATTTYDGESSGKKNNNLVVCSSFKELMDHNMDYIEDILNDHPDFMAGFKKHCSMMADLPNQ